MPDMQDRLQLQICAALATKSSRSHQRGLGVLISLLVVTWESVWRSQELKDHQKLSSFKDIVDQSSCSAEVIRSPIHEIAESGLAIS